MSEPEAVRCAKDAQGWCAIATGQIWWTSLGFLLKTMCGYWVSAMADTEHRIPDCPQCLNKLVRRAKRKAAREDKQQSVLF